MNIVTEKKCSACGEVKPVNQFEKRKDSNDGRRGKCVACKRAATIERKVRYRAKPDTKIKEMAYRLIYNLTHAVENSKAYKSYYAKARDKKLAYREQRKEHYKEIAKEYNSRPEVKERKRNLLREYRKKDPEKYKAIDKAYAARHPERILARARINTKNYINRKRGAEGHYSLKEWNQLCERYGNVCLCCKQPKKLEADHVIPISKGGSNTIDNIQPLCRSCNAKKHNKHIDYR